jgi:hypothetical protein
MNRKMLSALCLFAGLALCGTACTNKPASSAAGSAAPVSSPAASSQTAPASSQSVPASSAALTPEDIGRPATTKLPVSREGEQENVSATLFIGDGYSIYLTDGAWVHTQTASRADRTADVFTVTDNDQVTLSILPDYDDLANGNVTLDDAYEKLLAQGYGQSDDNDHRFAISKDGMVTCQYVVELSDVVWYVAWSYPDTSEYVDGWGAMLPAMADTFAVNPPSL